MTVNIAGLVKGLTTDLKLPSAYLLKTSAQAALSAGYIAPAKLVKP